MHAIRDSDKIDMGVTMFLNMECAVRGGLLHVMKYVVFVCFVKREKEFLCGFR